MFKHLLLPLDGSPTAEMVVPVAAGIAAILGAQVTLIHVIETDAEPQVHGERHLIRRDEAEAYLGDIRGRFFKGVPTVSHVHEAPMADVAAGIVLHEKECAPDLVVMCSHGRGGLRQLLFGRIAQQIVASGFLPVLLLRPEHAPAEPERLFDHILVPVDNISSHRQGIDAAIGLARASGGRLTLLSVVPTIHDLSGRQAVAGRFSPGATRVMLEIEEKDRNQQLDHLVSECKTAGVEAEGVIRRGDPAQVIAEVAQELAVDLISIGTHGKVGTQAFWQLSVGARILERTSRPMLLSPPCSVISD